uniref:Uncharacterized protein n=1 Tax=Pyramimonas obovata TaxID=1411642 RepID=A0A7S0WUK3_9CHLO|mmetsp:Transcript_4798/g.9791  ORF Transcript_4798/g.9791 Transcript_4798/m.9791 type:complete len:967 (+) Transcript_4798:146-3046(+)
MAPCGSFSVFRRTVLGLALVWLLMVPTSECRLSLLSSASSLDGVNSAADAVKTDETLDNVFDPESYSIRRELDEVEEVSPTPVGEEISPTPVGEEISPTPVGDEISPTPVLDEVSPTPAVETTPSVNTATTEGSHPPVEVSFSVPSASWNTKDERCHSFLSGYSAFKGVGESEVQIENVPPEYQDCTTADIPRTPLPVPVSSADLATPHTAPSASLSLSSLDSSGVQDDDATECKQFLEGYEAMRAQYRHIVETFEVPVDVPAEYEKCFHQTATASAGASDDASTTSGTSTPDDTSSPTETTSTQTSSPATPPSPDRRPSKSSHPTPPAPSWSTTAALESTPLGFIEGPDRNMPTCNGAAKQHGLGQRLHDTIKTIDETLNQIKAKMNLEDAELDSCMQRAHITSYFEPIRNKLKMALLSSPSSDLRTYTVVFGGTSVTAGHDNYYNESHPFVFERLASCAFVAAGLKLVVRNTAMGFNQGLPYSLCAATYYGEDTDLAIWEMGPMGNSDPMGFEDELAMRNFFAPELFPRRPAFFLMGGQVTRKEIWDKTPPACDHCHPDQYIHGKLCPTPACKYERCAECPKKWSQVRGREPSPVSRVQSQLLALYQAFGTGAVHPVECVGPLSDRWEFSATKLVRVAKQKHYDKGWHPGPYGHEMMAMVFAYRFLQEFKRSAEELLEARPLGLMGEAVRRWADLYSAREFKMSEQPLPPPLACSAKYCGSPSICATTLEPHRNMSFNLPPLNIPLRVVADDRPDDGAAVAPSADRLLGWAQLLHPASAPVHDMREFCTRRSDCPEELSAGAMFSLKKLQEVASRGMWAVGMMENTRKAVQAGVDYHNGYPDRKYTLMGLKQSGWLRLRFIGHASNSSTIILCEGACERGRCDSFRGYLATDAEFTINDKPVDEQYIHTSAKLEHSQHSKEDIIRFANTCIQIDWTKQLSGMNMIGIRSKSEDKVIMLATMAWF